MAHGQDPTTWRGDDPGFQTQAIGAYKAISDMADLDNVYLSDQGWAYRHFTKLDKSEYWDEIIWAGEVTVPPDENREVGVFGVQHQEFQFGNGRQSIGGTVDNADNPPPDDPDPIIGVVSIDGPYEAESGESVNYTATQNGDYDGTETYAWKVFLNDTDVTSQQTVTNGTSQTVTIVFDPLETIPAEQSVDYVVQCTIGGTDVDSQSGVLDVEVLSTQTAFRIGPASFNSSTKEFFEVGQNNDVRVEFLGNAPVGGVTPALTCPGNESNVTITGPHQSGPNFSGGAFFTFRVKPLTTIDLNTAIPLQCVFTDATALDNPVTITTSFKCEGTLGTIQITANPAGTIDSTQVNTIEFTSTQVGAAGDQSATTIAWSIGTIAGNTADKGVIENSISNKNGAVTNITFPANMAGGLYQVKCHYTNLNLDPTNRQGSINMAYLPGT